MCKKMDVASSKLVHIISKCSESKIDPLKLQSVRNFLEENRVISLKKCYLKVFCVVLLIIIGYMAEYVRINQSDCLIQMPGDLSKAFRPPEKCDFCRGVTKIERRSNISPKEFEKNYAYTGVPVIITDATKNWTALEVFDFWYFKKIYMNAKKKSETFNCQFFPYESGFKDFYEALNMPIEQVNYEPGTKPWYFGWSNCNLEVAEILRQHYDRLYFLPETSENNMVDWIFMGGPGLGAKMHVDNVRLPSWQAQLKGSKKWILMPPPECYFECNSFSVIVNKGEIIILDTNKWYHQTNVQPGELSITIGAEYD